MKSDISCGDSLLSGFRLRRFEALNWGTFDRNVWSLELNGENSLLTGDIGSGKSTLVDGLTTLFVSSSRITYNKAAGAQGRERTLRDYILGHYKKEKEDEALQAKSVALREQSGAITVLLAKFCNGGMGEHITLAQVFWINRNRNQVDKFYIVSSRSLTIENDFNATGSDVLSLKKKLRDDSDITVFDTFNSYCAEFRRHFNMQSDQPLNLLYQTVSMKSIGNLTDFVREHMLDRPPVKERIDNLCGNFYNLNHAHEAVLKAKAQIESLEPLIDDCEKHSLFENEINEFINCRESLYAFFASLKSGLLNKMIENLKSDNKRTQAGIETVTEEIIALENRREQIRQDIDDNGGRRLGELEREIERLTREREQKRIISERYAELCSIIEISYPDNHKSFLDNLDLISKKINELETEQTKKREEQVDVQLVLKQLKDNYDRIDRELNSLRQRPSNIPAKNLEIRKKLCETLNIDEIEAPFVGELIQVVDDESQWEGAIERLLHTFGLSLLVPDGLYAAIARYVDKTNLKGRLVYLRVKDFAGTNALHVEPDSLVKKIQIKPATPFYAWIENELYEKFDYVCCDTIDEFNHRNRAITKKGQIKSNRVRHEKDDRYNIYDRSRYVLGWRNDSKIKALEEQLEDIQKKGDICVNDIQKFEELLKKISGHRDAARDIFNIKNYDDICWKTAALSIEKLQTEIKEIVQTADILQILRTSLNETEVELGEKRDNRDLLNKELGSLNERLNEAEESLIDSDRVVNDLDDDMKESYFPKLSSMQKEALKDKKMTIKNCEEKQTQMRSWLQRRIDNENEKYNRLTGKIISRMQSYKDQYPLETGEVDADLDSINEFHEMLNKLEQDDLPKYEERFKKLLREGTIQDIALFQNQIEKEHIEIKKKIDKINTSLHEIEYNHGSYIKLVPDRTNDIEIRQFQEDLRLCLGDTLSGNEDEIYSENKFKQVKDIIGRFNGREGYADIDRRWTNKVTDVRNWFEFNASERWVDDDSEKEFYSDSAGKSGGQKEKLAYTVLAAALAFQFGLEPGRSQSRSFRFVMIDEAFGRGSDESARYGLELFKKLDLQLLIVTPLQKIHVIENYVRSVHFVYQEENRSMVGNLKIDDYKKNKEEHEYFINSQPVLLNQ